MALNLSKNKDSILAAWRDVVDDKSNTDWALFGYEGQTNDVAFVSKGDGGVDELKDDLNSGKIMYAFIRVIDPKTSLPKFVLINWQGEGAPALRKGTCTNHIRDISNLLKGAHVTVNARNEEEVDTDMIVEKVAKSTGSSYSFKDRLPDIDSQTTPVGTVYKKVIPRNEINVEERDKFWQKEEEEEKRRQLDEKRRNEDIRKKTDLETKKREAEENAKRANMIETNERRAINKDSTTQEAQTLIAQRNFDARAVFEQNTAAGQLLTRRLSSKDILNKAQEEVATQLKSDVPVSNTYQNNSIQNETKNVNGGQAKSTALQDVTRYEEVPTVKETTSKISLYEEVPPIEEITNDSPIEGAYKGDTVGLEDYDDTGLRAEALYDYQAADETEISFDPGDIITHIEQVDPGWWQGLGPDGTYGLFPANYVQLL